MLVAPLFMRELGGQYGLLPVGQGREHDRPTSGHRLFLPIAVIQCPKLCYAADLGLRLTQDPIAGPVKHGMN